MYSEYSRCLCLVSTGHFKRALNQQPLPRLNGFAIRKTEESFQFILLWVPLGMVLLPDHDQVRGNCSPPRSDYRSFDNVFQLSNISGEGISLENEDGIFSKAGCS